MSQVQMPMILTETAANPAATSADLPGTSIKWMQTFARPVRATV
jgi:hypothetical protein